jgi:diguanylate cyclase (GGDEF)-like protein
MQRRLAHEIARVNRFPALRQAGHHPSVVLLDIDNFKRLNDRFGHQAGDAVLRRVAAIVRETVRSFDIVARYGGEEFALILPGTNAATAREVAQRVRRAVGSEPMTVTEQGKHVRVTVSAGIGTAPENGAVPAQLIRAADAALYRSKQNGRNRVSHASDAPDPEAKVLAMDLKRRRPEPGGHPARVASRRARARSSLPTRRTPRA